MWRLEQAARAALTRGTPASPRRASASWRGGGKAPRGRPASACAREIRASWSGGGGWVEMCAWASRLQALSRKISLRANYEYKGCRASAATRCSSYSPADYLRREKTAPIFGIDELPSCHDNRSSALTLKIFLTASALKILLVCKQRSNLLALCRQKFPQPLRPAGAELSNYSGSPRPTEGPGR